MNLPETASWDAGVYQLETTDPVLGGATGASNKAAINLANRTVWLKNYCDTLAASITSFATLNSPVFTGNPTAPTPALGDNDLSLPTTAWVQATIGGMLTKSVAGASNVTLTAIESGNGILWFTGALTGNIAVIVPTSPTRNWIVHNGTSGSFSLTVKTATGTGVVVGQGKNTIIFTDGTDTYPAIINPLTQSNVVGLSRNAKMVVAAASASAVFSADEVVVESALGGLAYQLPLVSVAINLATTGAGGMDTGVAPSGGYVGLYLIYNPTSGSVMILATDTTSAVAPEIYGGTHMPSGFTASALVSVWRTDASRLLVIGTQRDRLIAFPDVQAFQISNDVYATISGSLSLAGVVPKNAFSLFGSLKMGSTGGVTVYGWAVSGANSVGQSGYDSYSAVPFSDLILATPQSLTYGVGVGSSPVVMTLYLDGYKF